MKIKALLLALGIAIAGPTLSLDGGQPFTDLHPEAQQARAAHFAAALLDRYHYRNQQLDDALSEKIFDLYLKHLDPEKLFFVQADVDALGQQARTKLDDAILDENLELPFAIFNLYVKRLTERYAYARTLLKQGFDFRQDDSLQYGRSKAPWAKSEDEVRELWRQRVKNDWLQLKLAGKDKDAIVQTLDKRYDHFIKRMGHMKSEDAFQAFMNAYTMAVEPHTNYLGRKASENFDISMKLSLVGIGAVLEEKDGYTVVRELVPGSPASLSKQLKVGDRIVGVAQGEKEAMTDVIGWRLDDTVGLIRGNADSVVVLDILPSAAGPDGKQKRVTLIRKKVSLEQQAAKKSLLTVKDGPAVRRIGVISLPAFYEDFGARQKGDPDYRSAARDVERLLGELKKDKVDSILIDLRNNGGGSLREAIDLTGLFIDKGPVVQERDARGKVQVEADTKAGAAWDGPLGVLINRGSASASEIFAAAIQDYGRGVIIGEQSFGKGTVQSMLNIDQVARSSKPEYGDLKLTIAQFFRINGGTTQLRGVTPDIAFPSMSDEEFIGESSQDYPLPWMQIQPAPYQKIGDLSPLLPSLVARHEARLKEDAELRQLVSDVNELQEKRKQRSISLNEEKRKQEKDKLEARVAAHKQPRQDGVTIVRDAKEKEAAEEKDAQADLADPLDESTLAKASKDDEDILLIEAARVLSDEIGLLEKNPRFAAGAKSPSPATSMQ
ncbi:MAG TPA: carboxy terminal-processing peptidase [Rhodocyclaceae bacterium]|nr:carboxy terminal-processing peptidase [Rhodocyclaceae bacterium]